ncbi:putative PIF1-like helicase/AAA domain containing protein [Leishmania shawi]|uniref:ATP-dependent DNA helicase n=1 Tax=Leishmania shawi TaxID=5680 RepID=A0AAW3BET4_9TRYP
MLRRLTSRSRLQKKFNTVAAEYGKRSTAVISTAESVHWKNVLPLRRQHEAQRATRDPSTLRMLMSASSQRAVYNKHRNKHISESNRAQPTAKEEKEGCSTKDNVTAADDQAGFCGVSDVTLLPEAGKAATEFLLTREQATVCDLACEGASLFIGGEAGTGKSYLVRAIAERLAAQGLRIAITASTGIAALSIGGNTFHSTFGVPLHSPDNVINLSRRPPSTDPIFDIDDASKEGGDDGGAIEEDVAQADFATGPSVGKLGHPRRLQFRNTRVLAEVDVVIIDEISMLHAGVLESFERAVRRMAGRDSSRPFGGLQMILSGDFLQLTPFGSVDAPLGRRRRYRILDEKNKCMEDESSIVCQCVSPDVLDAQGTVDKAATTAELAVKSRDTSASTTSTEVESALAVKQDKRKRASSVSDSTITQHRYRDLWYYDKPMFESWCFVHHLLHVQLREQRRQQDQVFSSDLNRLRQGSFPYRLSRSAFLNAPAEDAVRLLPTKRAVKNYNDSKMLALEGDEQLFHTKLTMTEAMCASSVGTAQEQRRGDAHSGGNCEAVLLVHYRLCSPTEKGKAALKRRGQLRDAEATAVARNLEDVCRFPRNCLQVYGLPAPLSYSASLSAVCVRCSGATYRIAESRRFAVKRLLEMWSGVPGTGSSEATSGNAKDTKENTPSITLLQSRSALFPREVVRVEAVEARQLMRRLQPLIQEHLRNAIRKDTVLQDKRLKVGCRVMLLRNLTQQYVNGSLGRVVGFRPLSACTELLPGEMKARATPMHLLAHFATCCPESGHGAVANAVQVPVVRMDTGGDDIAIPWITLPVSVAKQDWCFTLRATCIPLTPAYAFTVHKIQGVTLHHPVLFDAEGMFPCDHLVYVAASRVRKFEQLRMVNLSPRMISVHKPSLLFTQRIPSVEASVKRWALWKSKPRSEKFFYLPSHLTRVSTE